MPDSQKAKSSESWEQISGFEIFIMRGLLYSTKTAASRACTLPDTTDAKPGEQAKDLL
jgi:hypothetical protein